MEPSTEKILDRILEEANKKVNTILEEAKRSAKTILDNSKNAAEKNAKKEASEIIKNAKIVSETIREKVATDIKRKASWITLYEKDHLIEEVLQEAKKRLIDLKKTKEYPPILEDLIVNAGIVLGGGKLEVVFHKPNSFKSLNLGKIEQKIKDETDIKTELIISKIYTKKTGVIVNKINDKIFVDNTFEALIGRYEKKLRLEIAKILFSNKD
jgi:V/A-type H+-transporting ATPase subunit E